VAADQTVLDRERTRLDNKHGGWALLLLVGIATAAFIDRSILNTVGQALKDELHISDLQLGALGGAAFALLYSVLCVPVARLSERVSRVWIVCLSVIVWSAMTLLCGLATSFLLLGLARVGVGIGEAGVQAPSQSLIGDIFAPERRASALAVFGLATPIGIAIGGAGGGFVAQHYGWRAAFMLAALPGLFFAGLMFCTVREPVRGASEGAPTETRVPPANEVMQRLWASWTFRHILAGAMITGFIGFGLVTFTHAFFVRSFSMDYTHAGLAFVLMNSVSNVGGFLIGGLLTDKLIGRDIRFYGWVPAAGALLACPLYVLGFRQTHWQTALAVLMVPGLFSSTWYAPAYAVTQNLVTPRMRATAVALLSLAINLAGMALGPTITGALSDRIAARSFPARTYASYCSGAPQAHDVLCRAATAHGLRLALEILACCFLLSGMQFLLAARHMKRELRLGASRSLETH
jgi:MFS family permease